MLGNDDDPVGWVDDRFVLLVPPNAVVLVLVVAEQFDDLAPSGRLAVHSPRLDPISYVSAACRLCCHGGHIQLVGHGVRIGVGR